MKDFLIVGNLKATMQIGDVANYLQKIKEIDNKNVVICPSSIYLPYFLKQKYNVGIQNVFFKGGNYTGEISPLQVANMGVKYVMLGHSDRRIYFDEKDTDINKKILECLKYNLKVILCVGETNEDKSMLRTTKVLKKQLLYGLRNIENFDNIYVAYEPIWAVGTEASASIKDIEQAVLFIKDLVRTQFKVEDIKVLYGGSITSKNIKEIKQVNNLAGIVVGKSSIDADEFLKIIEEVEK